MGHNLKLVRKVYKDREYRMSILRTVTTLSILLILISFLSRKKLVYSMQLLNVKLKEIKKRYNVKIENFSCHSLRKCFGRKIFESSGENAQLALVKLSDLFNHNSVSITKIYLGLRQEEIMEAYDLLDF